LYKQSEARLIRGISLGAVASLAGYISYSLYAYPPGGTSVIVQFLQRFSAPVALVVLLFVLGCGFYFSFLNPKTSDFLIEVETEAMKIHWPKWSMVKGATGQVIVVMLFLMVFLFSVDFLLSQLRQIIF